MFSLIRLSRKKLPAIIAIFAILLLFVAPEVSKTLEHRRMENREEHSTWNDADNKHHMHKTETDNSTDDMSGMMADMDMSAGEMPVHHSMQPDSHQPPSMPDMPMMMHGGVMDDSACGYCVMLIHLPLMLWVFVAVIWLTLRVSNSPPPRLILRSFTVFFPGIAQPRAPPAY